MPVLSLQVGNEGIFASKVDPYSAGLPEHGADPESWPLIPTRRCANLKKAQPSPQYRLLGPEHGQSQLPKRREMMQSGSDPNLRVRFCRNAKPYLLDAYPPTSDTLSTLALMRDLQKRTIALPIFASCRLVAFQSALVAQNKSRRQGGSWLDRRERRRREGFGVTDIICVGGMLCDPGCKYQSTCSRRVMSRRNRPKTPS